MASPSETPSIVHALAVRLAVPFLILGFMGVFAYSSRDLQFMAAGYPRFLMLLMLPVMAIIILREVLAALREYRAAANMVGNKPEGSATSVWRDWVPSAALSLWLIAYVIALPRIGILAATAIFVPCVLVTLGYRSWVWVIVITVSTVLIIHLLFIRLFQLPLPGVW